MTTTSPSLLSIFLVFLKMGATAFGGNVALVAAIKTEIADKKKWVSDTEILDLMIVGNIIPGPLAMICVDSTRWNGLGELIEITLLWCRRLVSNGSKWKA